MRLKIGDYVCRLSHGCDIMFTIIGFSDDEQVVFLKGTELRLLADAAVGDLVVQDPSEVNRYRQRYLRRSNEIIGRLHKHRQKNIDEFLHRAKINYKKDLREPEVFELPGSVLHIDGDKEYLELCMNTYRQLNIKAVGFCVPECEQSAKVQDFLLEYTPDILILTGHDSILKGRKNLSCIDSYRNSAHFVRSVRKARELIPGRDDLVIFAGACQSHYESLIAAGSNFASSPKRVLIHAYDPVFIAEKVSYTPFYQMVNVREAINDTITGNEGVGGIETHGRLRLGYPKSPY